MTDAISISRRNPRYWRYDGEPVLLLGGSSEDNLFQIEGMETELDRIAAAGGNYVRCTMSSREGFAVWPFAEVGDGIYDLDRWNDEYWERFEQFLEATAARDIVVQVELWATFDYFGDTWAEQNPFNPENTDSYDTADADLLRTEPSSNPIHVDNPFFWSVPTLGDLEEVRAYQRRYVDKVLSYTLAYPNVLYCGDNETHGHPAWGRYWADYIRQRAHRRGRIAETTQMYRISDVRNPQHWATYDHPETYTYCDISQNSTTKAQTHWDRIQWVRDYLDPARPTNNVKIYGSDVSGTPGESAQVGEHMFWRNLVGGCASARFHRPPAGIGSSDRGLRNVAAARAVTDAIDVPACAPRNGLLSDREPDEAYALADPGEEYLVYFPGWGSVSCSAAGASRCRWYDIDGGKWGDEESVDGTSARLETPGDGQWVAVLS